MRKSATEVRKEGWLYRESGYVGGLVNPRYGAIYPHALVTFRRVAAAPHSFWRSLAWRHGAAWRTMPCGICRQAVFSCLVVWLRHHPSATLTP